MSLGAYEYELAFEKPIEYKKLKIYPFEVKDYVDFMNCIDILTIQKNKIPDPRILMMSYLEYMYELITSQSEFSELCKYKLYFILSKSFNEEEVKFGRDKNNKVYMSVGELVFDQKEFEEIRLIICQRNMPDYNEDYIDPELEKEIEFVRKTKNKNSKDFTLESQIECIMLFLNKTSEELENLTIRRLIRLLRMADAKMHYQIYKAGEASGAITFKKELEHWFYTSSPDKLEGVLMGYDEVKNKINIQ